MSYRVLHATSDQVAMALFSPMKPSEMADYQDSRLLKYFRVKSKVVRGDTVQVEFLPTIPQVEKFLPSTDPIKITLTKDKSYKNTFYYKALIETSAKFIRAKMILQPHTSGSLMSIELDQTNINDHVVDLFYFVSKQLGLLSDKP